jgi:hypothetical protein
VRPDALLLAPLVCGLALLLSGWAKRGDLIGTREAFVALNVPQALRRRWVANALPYVELGLGLAVIVTWGWLLAAVAVVVTMLFVAYTVLVARVLQQGQEVECHCFGSLGDDHVSVATLARNLLFVLFGALAVAFGLGGRGLLPALGDLDREAWWWLVLATVVAATAVLVLSRGVSGTSEIGPDEAVDYVRQPIPYGTVHDERGTAFTLRQLAWGRPHLLVFLSVGCGSCDIVAEALPGYQARLGPVVVSTVYTSPLADLPEEMRPAGIGRWFDPDSAVTQMLADGRPAAVLFGADGLIAGGPVIGARPIEDFVAEIESELADAPSLEEPVEETVEEAGTAPSDSEPAEHGHQDDHSHSHSFDAPT